MKTIYIKLICAICVFSGTLVSCSDYLDKEPDTELTTEMVFDNRDKVYSWLGYVYNIIHTPDKWALTADGYEVFADDITPSAMGLGRSHPKDLRTMDHQLHMGW